ncbi:Proteasome [Nucleospora cyclopteri]
MSDFTAKIYHIFNTKGQIEQIQHAFEALNNSIQLVSVSSDEHVVTVYKKPQKSSLQEEEVCLVRQVADNIYIAMTGEPGDLINITRRAVELASAKEYTFGCVLTPDIFTRNLADKFQSYIQQSYSRCPIFAAHVFGVENGKVKLYYTDLSAVDYRCYACASGEDSAKMSSFLEKSYKRDSSKKDLIISAISTVLQSIGKEAEHNEIGVSIFSNDGKLESLSSSEIDNYLQLIAELQ